MKARAIVQLLLLGIGAFVLAALLAYLDVQVSWLWERSDARFALPPEEPLIVRYFFASILSLGFAPLFGPLVALLYAFVLCRFVAVQKKRLVLLLNGIAFCLLCTLACIAVASTAQWTAMLVLFLRIPPYVMLVALTHIFLAVFFLKENTLHTHRS